MEEIFKVFENNHVDPPWSHVFVLSLDLLAIGAVVWCVREVLQAKRAAAQAKLIEESISAPVDGARFVAGRVELAKGAEMAVRVTIVQEGTQKEHKGHWTHVWKEVQREVEAVPFYLLTAKGERVRVEPPTDVMLVDKLDQLESVEATSRRKRAELTAGEHAVIEGRLERGLDPELQGTNATYRTVASSGWIMKADKRRGMSVSAESLSRRHELRARAFRKAAKIVALVNVMALTILLPYRWCLLFGEDVVANYAGKQSYLTQNSKGRETVHYAVMINYTDDAKQFYRERRKIDRDDYDNLPDGNGGKIWLRYVATPTSFSVLGQGSSVDGFFALLYFGVIGAGIYFIARNQKHRRWYEGNVTEEGKGPLPDPTKSIFVADQIPVRMPASQHREPIEAIEPNFSDLKKDDS